MNPEPFSIRPAEVADLLRGDTDRLAGCPEGRRAVRALGWVVVIVAGSGLFGAAIGWWRSGLQAAYTGLKFPLVILLTTLINALINALLAPLLGLNLRFRESLEAVLATFTVASAVLGAFSPILVFLVWNMPRLEPGAIVPFEAYRFIQLTEVGLIAFAGVAAHVRLAQWLTRLGGSRAVAWRVLIAWLAVNLLLGSQLTWILRPFIGAPHLPVEFLRPNAFDGNFFETVFQAVRDVIPD